MTSSSSEGNTNYCCLDIIFGINFDDTEYSHEHMGEFGRLDGMTYAATFKIIHNCG